MKKSFIGFAMVALVTIGLFAITGCGTKGNANDGNFINDNDSYYIIIDGKKFTAGDKIKDLSSVGYNLKSSEVDVNISANKYMIGAGHMMNSENKNIFNVTPYNTKGSAIKVSESVIGGVEINYLFAKKDEKSANFEVYGGIKLGSTQEEVKNAFGEPSMVSNGTNTTTYIYESDETYRNYKFTFNEEEKVTIIQWQNLVFNE